MFLNTLIKRNKSLFDYAYDLHKNGEINPDTYVIDVDTMLENATKLKAKADKYGIKLFFMLKQIGRNPYIARKLVEIGYDGAVVVDFKDAQVMMENKIKISHIGHLVQIPKNMIREILEYGVDFITVYSLEKALEINEVCKELNITQKIMLKFISENDLVYPSQESGFDINELEYVISEIKKMSNVRVSGITSFPAFLVKDDVVQEQENLKTLIRASEKVEAILGYKLERNMPSCTQIGNIEKIAKYKGTQGEPGNSFAGTIPNNYNGSAVELPTMVYVSEVSHNYKDLAYCYGGGMYVRSHLSNVAVFDDLGQYKIEKAIQPNSQNIDYCFQIKGNQTVSSTVIASFRTQIFVTRSTVALVVGLSKGQPKIIAKYDSQGKILWKKEPL